MNPNTKIEQKLPEWSEAEKTQKQNKELRKILTKLHIIWDKNPEHPVNSEIADINNRSNQKGSS